MSLRQAIHFSIRPVNRESLNALNALQLAEAAERDTSCSSRETENFCPLVAVEGLECPPPPDDNRVGTGVSVIFGRPPPLVDIDIRRPGD